MKCDVVKKCAGLGPAPLLGLFLMSSIVLMATPLFADTVYLKDGSTVDGTVVKSDAEEVVVEIGGGNTTFRAADVARIEKNDKKGGAKSLSVLRAKQHMDDLDQRTGLTAKQREEVRMAIEPLWSPDEAERSTARRKLLAMNKDMGVFKYLESYLPYAKGLVAPEILKTLVDIDPVKAKDTVLPFAQNYDPANRAKALEIIASYKSDDDLETLSRGLLDVDNSVRIAAAHAVAAFGSKRATPVLLQGLQSTDLKVQNASRETLKTLWGAGNANIDLRTPEEWNAFWKDKSREVKDPISVAHLTPLVTPEELAETTASHDE